MTFKIKFIWERNGQYLHINENLKYLFYYRGCFCPPHKGHYSAAAKYLGKNNIRMIIHQIGSERHGISKNTNRQIWKTYINNLLPRNNVDLIQYDDDNDDCIRSHRWFQECDVLVILRGDEYDDIHERQQQELISWRSIINTCARHNKHIMFVYDIRDSKNMSASTLIRDLILFKNKRLVIESLYKYFPENLDVTLKIRIINKLIEYHLV